MDVQEAQKILDQAPAAEKVLEEHRRSQLTAAYRKFAGLSSNAKLIAALQDLARSERSRTRIKVTVDFVNRVKQLEKAGARKASISKDLGASYMVVTKVLKGAYDDLLPKTGKPRAKKQRKTNNVRLADLTDKEIVLIKKAKSYKDIAELPKGSKNAGKKVMYAVYASVNSIPIKGSK